MIRTDLVGGACSGPRSVCRCREGPEPARNGVGVEVSAQPSVVAPAACVCGRVSEGTRLFGWGFLTAHTLVRTAANAMTQ